MRSFKGCAAAAAAGGLPALLARFSFPPLRPLPRPLPRPTRPRPPISPAVAGVFVRQFLAVRGTGGAVAPSAVSTILVSAAAAVAAAPSLFLLSNEARADGTDKVVPIFGLFNSCRCHSSLHYLRGETWLVLSPFREGPPVVTI